MRRRTCNDCGWLLVACVAFAASATGCAHGDRLPVVPTTGQVTVKGVPADGALVMFVPVEQAGAFKALRPQARCNEQGRFVLSTYEAGDGAPPGKYQVSIQWRGPSPEYAATMREEEKYAGPDRLQEKYSDPGASGLTATVGPAATEVPTFALP